MWKATLIGPDTTILETISIIDRSALQIALVVNAKGQLLGTVTDGDIRRAILKHISLNQTVDTIMNSDPWYVKAGQVREDIQRLMQAKKIHQIPVVDEDLRVIGLETPDNSSRPVMRGNLVIFMAGGPGRRLYPLTKTCPKPMLRVGDKPILETILEGFIADGFRDFIISVHYRADMIMQYFGDGSKWQVRIGYLLENKPLGTAGSLGLLRPKPQMPILVMNGDILTKTNYSQLVDFHLKTNSLATVCITEQFYQIPYGTVTFNSDSLLQLDEKPILKFFINAGMYVLNPEVLDYIKEGLYLDFTDLIKTLLNEGKRVAVFPIREYWLDIGHIENLEKANTEFKEIFR